MGKVFQQSAQFASSGKDAPRDRGLRATQRLAGFGMAETLIHREDQGRPLFGREPQQGLFDLFQPFGLPGAGVLAAHFLLFGPELMKMLPATRTLVPIQAEVDGDAAQPGGEGAAPAELIETAIGSEKSFLGQVFGLGHRTGHAIGQAVYHALITFHQGPERLRIAFPAAVDPIRLIIHCAHADFACLTVLT